MNKHFWITVVRENWYLVAALVVCVGAFAYKVTTSSDEAGTTPPAPSTAAVAPGVRLEDGLDKLQRSPSRDREKALAVIQSHQAKVDANPRSEEAPALLSAMGNLYGQKLGDYTQAATCYETVIRDHADWGQVRTAYLQLATCYERMDDRENARRVYRLMMEKFPADSQEYQYANAMTYEGAIPKQAQ